MNRSLSNVSKSIGSLTMTFRWPSSSASGRMAFSRATDSGTNSTTEGGIDDFAEIDVVQAVLLGHRPHHFFARGIAQPDQGVGQLHARLGGHLLGFGELLGADDALADEDFRIVAFLLAAMLFPVKSARTPIFTQANQLSLECQPKAR